MSKRSTSTSTTAATYQDGVAYACDRIRVLCVQQGMPVIEAISIVTNDAADDLTTTPPTESTPGDVATYDITIETPDEEMQTLTSIEADDVRLSEDCVVGGREGRVVFVIPAYRVVSLIQTSVEPVAG